MKSSFKRRYFFTILTSIFRSLIAFVTGMLLARFLGPKQYGNMSFLIGIFLSIRQLLDMGTSQAFFTFMSQRLRPRIFITTYFLWLFIQFIIILIVIGLFFPINWIQLIWHGENRSLILIAFAASFMQNSVWPSVQQSLEAQRLTYKAQSFGIVIVFFHLIAVLILYFFKKLGIYSIFFAIFIEYVIASFIAYRFIQYEPENSERKSILTNKGIYKMYSKYCTPIILYSWVGFLYSFADTWLLHKFGGSVNQAYYSIGSQVAAISLFATTSILNIFYKEIAEAFHNNNLQKASLIYYKVSRSLFLISATISCFLIPWTKDILNNLLGSEYINGNITLAIMLLYPIHQSLGQIGGTIFYATEQVKLQSKIGIIFMLISIIVTYFILAPNNMLIPGLNLGSEGLALKMVLMQFIQVNIIAYIISSLLKSKFEFSYQFLTIIIFLGLSFASYYVIISLIGTNFAFIPSLIFCAIIYLVLILSFIFIFPWITGNDRKNLLLQINHLKIEIYNIVRLNFL